MLYELLQVLAHEGVGALSGFAEGDSTILDSMIEYAILENVDIRHGKVQDIFPCPSTTEVAGGIRKLLREAQEATAALAAAKAAAAEAREEARAAVASVMGAIRVVDREEERKSFLCGTGIEASAPPPSAARAADHLIWRRECLTRALAALVAAEETLAAAEAREARLRVRAAKISVGNPGAIWLP